MRHSPKDLLRKSRPTPATIISVLALVVATGGTSYAALSITGKDVVNQSLSGKDIKNQTLTGKDVKNASLKGKDFAPGQLPPARARRARRVPPAPDAGCSSTPRVRSRPSRVASR